MNDRTSLFKMHEQSDSAVEQKFLHTSKQLSDHTYLNQANAGEVSVVETFRNDNGKNLHTKN